MGKIVGGEIFTINIESHSLSIVSFPPSSHPCDVYESFTLFYHNLIKSKNTVNCFLHHKLSLPPVCEIYLITRENPQQKSTKTKNKLIEF